MGGTWRSVEGGRRLKSKFVFKEEISKSPSRTKATCRRKLPLIHAAVEPLTSRCEGTEAGADDRHLSVRQPALAAWPLQITSEEAARGRGRSLRANRTDEYSQFPTRKTKRFPHVGEGNPTCSAAHRFECAAFAPFKEALIRPRGKPDDAGSSAHPLATVNVPLARRPKFNRGTASVGSPPVAYSLEFEVRDLGLRRTSDKF